MDIKLKQRMVGAIVLTMLAIIILPMLLDGSAEERAQFSSQIPVAPDTKIERLDIEAFRANMAEIERQSEAQMPIEFPDKLDDEVEAIDTVETETISKKARADKEYQLNESLVPVSWVIQLGSFRSEANALKLRADLRTANFRTYVLQTPDDKGAINRVFVGPMLNKRKLSEIAEEIQLQFKLEGKIVRYNIAEDVQQLGG